MNRITYLTQKGLRFDNEGDNLVGIYNGTTLLRRYVYEPGATAPILWYEGTGPSADHRFMDADERGSIIRISGNSGGTARINTYDEFGVPGANNLGRFGYTGHIWLPEAGMYYARNRMYEPKLGRFMQTDPIGYDDGMNLYNYVGSDPINATDPTGLETFDCGGGVTCDTTIIDVVRRPPLPIPSGGAGSGASAIASSSFGNSQGNGALASAVANAPGLRTYRPSFSPNTAPAAAPQAIRSDQIACRSCHGVATELTDRYLTQQENDTLVDYVGIVGAMIPVIGPEYRAALSMNTGRVEALNLSESLLMRQVRSNPRLGTNLNIRLGDPRLGSGAIKLEQRVPGAAVHYVRLPNGTFVDFKFVR